MISTRGRYAVRVMLDLAENANEDDYIPIKEIAERQEISRKYLEHIMPALVKNGLVEALAGKGGGYRLVRAANDYSIGEILRVTEGDLAPVACLRADAKPCKRREFCKTLPMWTELYEETESFFENTSLESLM